MLPEVSESRAEALRRLVDAAAVHDDVGPGVARVLPEETARLDAVFKDGDVVPLAELKEFVLAASLQIEGLQWVSITSCLCS